MTNELTSLVIFFLGNATLAQLVEQLIRNEQVVGSSPISGSYFQYIFHFIVLNLLNLCIFAN